MPASRCFPGLFKRAIAIMFTALLACLWVAAQEYEDPKNEHEGDPRARMEWFYGQRAYPLRQIPKGARARALQQLEQKLAAEEISAAQSASVPDMVAASSSQWTPIGPRPTSTHEFFTLTSGRVTALAVDPSDPNQNTVYLGSAEGGVWKTTDGGSTWVALTDGQACQAIGAIAIDPSHPSTIYAGTGEANFSGDAYFGCGILKSTDGGASWTPLGTSTFNGPFNSLVSGARIGGLAVHPTSSGVVLAAVTIISNQTNSGIYRSVDGGASWSEVLPAAAATAVMFDPINPSIAYAAIGRIFNDSDANGIYKSTDGGVSWFPSNGSLPSGRNVGRIALALAPSNPNILYAGLQAPINGPAGGSLLGFFKSVDGGASWNRLTATPDYCNAQCWYDNVIAVSPTNPNIVFVGGSDIRINPSTGRGTSIFQTLNGGATWTRISPGPSGEGLHPDSHAFAFSIGGGRLYVGNDGGVWSTNDVGSATPNWNNLNNSLSLAQFYPGISIHPSNVNSTIAGTQDNGTQRYTGGLGWENITCGDGGWTAIDPINPANMYAACQNIQILQSTSGGDAFSWARMQVGIDTTDRVAFIPPLVIDKATPSTLYFGTFRLWQTRDAAASWSAISPDLTFGSGTVSAIAVAPTDSSRVFTVSSDGRVSTTTSALAGAGATWFDVTRASLSKRAPTMVQVDPHAAGTAYVTFSGYSGFVFGDNTGHVFKTVDGGGSWTDISGDLPNVPANDIAVDPDNANSFYLATDVGIFRTTNGGVNWIPLVTGMPRALAIISLKLHQPTRILRAATHGRGMYDLALTALAAVSLSQTAVAFGNQRVGTTSAPQAVILTNTGTGILNITSLTTTSDFAQTNTCGSSVAMGASCTISITFSPSAMGASGGSVSLNDNAPSSPQIIALMGTGIMPAAALSATALAFGAQRLNTPSAVQTITLSNNGNMVLAISSITISGDFSQSNSCGISLAAGSSCAINVTFIPTVLGPRTGTVTINDNADNTPHTVSLTGTGIVVTVSPQSLTFHQSMGATSAPQTITLTNFNSVSISISSITTSTDFAQTSTCGTSVPASGSCNISVTFNPSIRAIRNGTLTISDSSPDSPQVVVLLGVVGNTHADFQGDGKSDILWRNSSTGQDAIWLMNGTSSTAQLFITPVADPSWQMVGTGDFDGDGNSDILWRNRTTGLNAIWLMNGTSSKAQAFITTVADANWKIVGVGDFDGDGRADILWRNSSTGQNAIWLMNGSSSLAQAFITPVAGPNWQIVSTGDFDGDGKADILWRNSSNGQNAIWLMNGTSSLAQAFITTVGDTTWQIAGTGDFNGDGNSDILWRNSSNGLNAIWLMNGTSSLAQAFITPVPDPNWQIVSAGDFDGDGKADILWRNSSNGLNAIWLMNGTSSTAQSFITPVGDTNWKIAP